MPYVEQSLITIQNQFASHSRGMFSNKFLRLNITAIATGILLGLIFYIKAITIPDGTLAAPILITTFIVVFELSRVATAIVYAPRKKKIHDHYEPTVSFVIPCMNEEASIGATIDKCFQANYPANKLEVIVINDGSTDNTLAVLRKKQEKYPQLKIIDFKINKGKRAGMRAGFLLSKSEIVIQLDSDSWVEPSTFRYLIDPFIDPKVGAVSGHTDLANPDVNILTKMQVAYYYMSFRVLKAAESVFEMVFCCSGCCSAYRKKYVLPHLDEWENEAFFGIKTNYGDDRALTNRILIDGYKTIYSDDVQAYTYAPTKLKQFLKQQVRWKKGWFINTTTIAKKILKLNWFVGLTYLFPLIFVTLITPFVAFNVFILGWLVYGHNPIYYIIGVGLVSLLLAFHHFYQRNDKYWPYMLVWSGINMIMLTYVMIYALLTIRDNRWGTR